MRHAFGPAGLFVAMLMYVAAPGHPDLPLHGLPLGLAGTVVAAAALLGAAIGRHLPLSRRIIVAAFALVATLAAGRVAIAAVAAPHGWHATYFASDDWTGTPQWSSDFRWHTATRRDAALAFEGDRFPVHYLNDHTFARDTRREVSEPMSVVWTGHLLLADAAAVDFTATFRGTLRVDVDSATVLAGTGAAAERLSARAELAQGLHVVTVRYAKPAGVDGLLQLDATDASGARLPIRAPDARRVSSSWLFAAAAAADAAVVSALAVLLLMAGAAMFRDPAWRLTAAVAALAILVFGIHGWIAASSFDGRYAPLGAGDDWFGFESRARDILRNGPLMTLDAPPGQGAAYFYHPFYSYFLAAVHAVSGESLAGPVFVHFAILAVVTIVMWRLTRRHFGDPAAAAGSAALIALFEIDFARYYTVTLLSENLYILTVTATLAAFVRWVGRGARSDLAATGIWAGLSSITRPAMLVFLVPALIVVATVVWRRSHRLTDIALAGVLLAAVWMAVVAPVTLRNWFVSGRAVLVSEGVGSGVIRYNVPPGIDVAPYLARDTGSAGSGLSALARIAWDHPWQVVKLQVEKIGFSLGMVHWRHGYRPHPELAAATLLYLVMCWLSPVLRAPVFWPVHAFVATHVASMCLTDPSNYGYRLILPPFVYTTSLGVAAFVAWWRGQAPASGLPA